MKKSLVALIAMLMIFTTVLTGCGSKEEKKETKEGGSLKVGVTSFADTLEPTEQYFGWVVSRYGVGETLVKYDEKGEPKAGLAKKWEVSDDNLTWTFELRKDVKFSDGTPMTAEIVKESIERSFAKNERAATYFEIASIEAKDDKLLIKTTKPAANLVGSLGDPLFIIVNTKADQSKFASEGPICTGPYKVSSFKAGETCEVVRNDNYWGDKAPLDKVEFKCIDDQKTRALALQSGEIDVAYNLKSENLGDFEGNDEYGIEKLDSLRNTFAFMNQHGVLKDKVLRQALIRGIDKKTYTEKLLNGGATPAKAPVPPTLDYGYKQLKDENKYDKKGAIKLLDEAGYKDVDNDGFRETPDGKPLDIKFLIYSSRSELKTYAEAAQTSLKDIGIKVSIENVSYETILDKKEAGEYDLVIWNMLVANSGDPEGFLRENWHSKSANNTAGYANDKVDKLLDELSETFDKEKRKEIIIDIQQEIMDDAAAVYFGYEKTFLFHKADVKGLKLYPIDFYWLTNEVSK